MTARPGSHGRPITCAKCGRQVGMLPCGHAVPWRVEEHREAVDRTASRIVCADDRKCRLQRLLKGT